MMEPTRRRGFSEPYGSWKIIWISRRTGCICRRGQVGDVLAVEADHVPEVTGMQPRDAAGQRGLAAAGLADQPERLAAADGQRDPVDGLDVDDLDLVPGRPARRNRARLPT